MRDYLPEGSNAEMSVAAGRFKESWPTRRDTTSCVMTWVSLPVYSEISDKPSANFEKTFKEDRMDNENDTVGGYAIPVDPMDLLQCDSCQ